MTLMQLIKQLLGGREDIDLEELSALNNDKNTSDNTSNVNNNDNNKEDKLSDNDNKEGDDTNMIFEQGWIREDGTVDLSKVHDKQLKGLLESYEQRIKEIETKYTIESALQNELANAKLAVPADMVKKLIDVNNIKVEEGKVVGIKEQLDSLKQTAPQLFETKESKITNPLETGFDPVVNTNTQPKSLIEALAMQTITK